MITPNRILATVMLVLLIAAIALTYDRAMLSGDFEVVDDLDEESAEEE